MKKILSLLNIITVATLFASCNLFIEDEYDEALEGFQNVPVHTGDGYDAPATYQDENCTVTYQFKSNVRVIRKDDITRYVRSAEYDITSLLVEIHFDGNTPADKLPHEGEILVCSDICDTFPYGLNHKVQAMEHVGNVYKYLCSYVKLEDTYEVLDIDGTMTAVSEEHYVAEPDPETDESQQTRADDKPKVDGGVEAGIDVDILKDGFSFGMSHSEGFKLGDKKYVEVKTNMSVKVINQFDFKGFSLKDMNLTFKYKKTIEGEIGINVAGGVKGEKKLKSWHPVKGKVFTIGYVVIVFFIDIDLVAEAEVTASLNFTVTKKRITTYIVDLANLTIKEDKNAPDANKKEDNFTLSGALSGSAGIRLDLKIGFGLYGKVLSVKIIPSIWLGIEAELPVEFFNWDSGEGMKLDISEGLALKAALKLSGKIGVFLDLSLEALIGDDAASAVKAASKKRDKKAAREAANDMLKHASELCAQNSEAYNKLSDEQRKAADDINSGNNDEKDLGLYVNFGPWDLLPKQKPWFPKIKDNTFAISKYLDGDKMTFEAQYEIKDEGFFCMIGSVMKPGLLITTENDKFVRILYPKEGGKSARVTKGKTYHFNIPTTNDDKMYKAAPCYFGSSNTKTPDLLDKALPFSATSPMVYTTYKPVSVSELMQNTKPSIPLPYYFTFKVKSTTYIKGMGNIYDWYLETNQSNERHYPKKLTKVSDTEYTFRWTITQYTLLHSSSVKFSITSNYRLKDDLGNPGKWLWGNDDSVIIIRTNHTYERDDETHSFARSMTPFDQQEDEGLTEVVLNSIEDADGNIVWQNPDCPPDDWSEDEETPFVLHHF